MRDALDVAKAVSAYEVLTCIALFGLTRLEGIPRSTLAIHALILATGLVAFITSTRILASDRRVSNVEDVATEYIILIGSNPFFSVGGGVR